MMVAAILIACIFVVIVLSFVLSPAANYISPQWMGNPMPPCFQNSKECGGHILGTDEIGRDLLVRLVVGARVSLAVSLMAALMAFCAGAALGALARYGGAIAKFLILCASDAVSCFAKWPFILALVVIFMTTHKSGFSTATMAAVAAIFFWPKITRLIADADDSRDLSRPLISLFLRTWATIILLIATVDFFGYGVQPPTPSLGNMLADMQANLQTAWWSAIFPGILLFAIVFGIEVWRRIVLGKPVALQTQERA
jgi:peptide/nickel transport system permease protein